jgi:DNA polymerase
MLDLPAPYIPEDPNDPYKGSFGPRNARVIIVGEAYGESEDRAGRPFCGASGQELMAMLKEAGINPDDCLFTNVINRRPDSNNFNRFLIATDLARKDKLGGFRDAYPNTLLMDGLANLYQVIERTAPDIIIALGNYALWALTDKATVKAQKDKHLRASYRNPTGTDTWRGSQLWTNCTNSTPIPVLPTYHPAGILRNWSWRHIAVQDLRRVTRFLKQSYQHDDPSSFWKDPRKPIRIIQPAPSVVVQWIDRALSKGGDLEFILDVETFRGQIHIVGIRDATSCLCIPFMDIKHVAGFETPGSKPCYSKWEFVAIYEALRKFLAHPRVYLSNQNLLYDLQYLIKWFGVIPKVRFDTMVATHICFPDDPKALDFLASIHCEYYSYWKDDRKESLASDSTYDACVYNCDDLDYTHEVAEKLKMVVSHFKLDQLLTDRMELFDIVLDGMLEGVLVDVNMQQQMAVEILVEMQEITHFIEGCIPDFMKPVRKPKQAPWYASNKELGIILYDKLRLPAMYDKKSGARTVKKEALTMLSERVPHWTPFLNAITIYRSLGVFYNTFILSRTDYDNRWRTSYNIAGPETYRLSSSQNAFGSGLNMQNIPREREDISLLNALEVLG